MDRKFPINVWTFFECLTSRGTFSLVGSFGPLRELQIGRVDSQLCT